MRTTNRKNNQGNAEKARHGKWGLWLILALLAFSLFFYQESLRDIRDGVRRITALQLWHSVLLSLAAYFLEGATIFRMMGFIPRTVASRPMGRGVKIAYLCEFYRLITLGSGSGLAEIHYMHESGIETGSATALSMLQYISKRMAVMALGVPGFLILYAQPEIRTVCRGYTAFMAAGALISVAVIALLLCAALSSAVSAWICRALDWLADRFPTWRQRFSGWKEQAALLCKSGKLVLRHKGGMARVFLLQIGKLLLFYSIPAYLLLGDTCLTVQGCICFMAVSYMLSGVIPTPSGAGSLEFVFLLFFTRFTGVDAAVPAIMVFRFATWIVPFLIGGAIRIYDGCKEG